MTEHAYHHGNLKAQLIREGLKLLTTEGYERFSLRKVAALCGVSQTAPYRHFHSKDELIGAITEHALENFAQTLQAAVDKHPGEPRAQLKEMGVAYVRFFAGNPEYLRLLFLSDAKLKERFFKEGDIGRNTRPFLILRDTVARSAETGSGLPYSQDEMVLFSWGLVHGLSTLIASGELPNDEKMLALIEKIIRGLY